jgi:hypothetical protein
LASSLPAVPVSNLFTLFSIHCSLFIFLQLIILCKWVSDEWQVTSDKWRVVSRGSSRQTHWLTHI